MCTQLFKKSHLYLTKNVFEKLQEAKHLFLTWLSWMQTTPAKPSSLSAIYILYLSKFTPFTVFNFQEYPHGNGIQLNLCMILQQYPPPPPPPLL